jgi:hypothetical protein
MVSAVVATSAGSSELTMMLRPFDEKPAASETWTSKPSVLIGVRALERSVVATARSAVSASRTVSVALLAGRPLWADRTVWKLVSPSPGIVVWMSSTGSYCPTIASASMARSRTASEVAPVGGAMLTARIFSEPALMNWVGSSGTIASEATNIAPARPTTASLVQRPRRTNRMVGV